jgi:hypothetical protein
VASGTVFLTWQSGGESKVLLHFSISSSGGDDLLVTLSGKIVSGQFAGDTISDDGDMSIQTSTGSACATAQSGGEPLLGGTVHPNPTIYFTG